MEKDKLCFQVKEGYEAYGQQMNHAGGVLRRVPIDDALTLRSVEDVRREAYADGYRDGFKKSGWSEMEHQDVDRYKIDTPAPSRVFLSGGFGSSNYMGDTPSSKGALKDPHDGHMGNNVTASREKRPHQQVGTFEDMPEELIDEAYAQPTPSPVAWRMKDFADGWVIFMTEAEAKMYAEPVGATVQPLYTAPSSETQATSPEPVASYDVEEAAFRLAKAIHSMTEGDWEPNIRQSLELVQYATPPDTRALQAEELRKAKAEAWDAGRDSRWSRSLNPHRRSTDEGEA